MSLLGKRLKLKLRIDGDHSSLWVLWKTSHWQFHRYILAANQLIGDVSHSMDSVFYCLCWVTPLDVVLWRAFTIRASSELWNYIMINSRLFESTH